MRTNITRYTDYRDVIKVLCKEQKISFKALAQSARIHTSYFSRVMGLGADFSSSQLFLVAKDLGLSEWELEYFLLLGEVSAAASSEHKAFLMEKVKSIQKEKQKIARELKQIKGLQESHIREYYKEAVTAKVHMYLTIDKFRKNPLLIAQKIMIPEYKLNLELKKLEELGLIKNHAGKLDMISYNIHLDETDPVSAANHINWRLESINNIQRRTPRPSDYHLSAVFSTDEETKIKIKDMFKEFVIAAQKETTAIKGHEEVFQICFDLY